MVEGTCSFCLGYPPSKSKSDLLNFCCGHPLTVSQHGCWDSVVIDDDLVQESAWSLL